MVIVGGRGERDCEGKVIAEQSSERTLILCTSFDWCSKKFDLK